MELSPASHLDDEALSASLDATRAGDAPDDVDASAHLAGCADCTRRRQELAEARAALADAPVEPVDELTRRRLLARALAEPISAGAPSPFRTWHRRPALAGAVAAAILAVLVAVPFLTRGERSTDRTESAAARPSRQAATFLGDLGEVSTPEAVRSRLGASTMADVRTAADSSAASKSAGESPTGPPPAERYSAPGAAQAPDQAPIAPAAPTPSPLSGSSGAEAARPQDLDSQIPAPTGEAVAGECTSRLASGPARGSRLVATGVGTLRGTPVVVSVFATSSGDVAYVTAQDGCGLLQRYSL